MNHPFFLEGRGVAWSERPQPPVVVSRRSRRLSRRQSYFLLGTVLLLGTRSLSAAPYYWDLNGATAGSGGPTPSGTWDTTTHNWSTSSTGTTATVAYPSSLTTNTADFSAGTDATGAYTVTVSGTIQTAGITFEEGTVTLAGTATPSLQIGGTSGIIVNSGIGGTTTLDSSLGTVGLGGNQSWANNSASPLVVNSAVSNVGNTTAYTLTLSGTGTGGTTINGNITDGGVTGTVALSITTASQVVKIAGTNSYTGGTTIGTSATVIAGSPSALGAAGAAVSLANSSTLDLASDTSTNAYNLTTSGSLTRTILSDRATSGSGLTQTLGTVLLGTAQLNIAAGANVTGGSPAVAFAAVTLNNASGGSGFFNPTTAGVSLASVTNGATGAHTGSLVLDGTNANNVVTGVIANDTGSNSTTFSISKSNSSVWTFTGANIYDGSTTISGGTLDLGGSTANGSITSTTSNEGLFLSGGTLKYTRTGGTTQSFFSTRVASGASAVNNAVSSDTVALNAITRLAGATVDFTPTGNITTLTANTSAGILGGYATVGGTDWAVSAGTGSVAGNISALTSYTTLPTTTTTATTNNDILSATGTTTLGGAVSINSLKFNTTGTLALGANNLTFNGINGGLLVTANGGSISGSAGYIGSGAANEFIVTTAGSNSLTINSNIIGNATSGALTKTGTGTLVLSSANNYTGATFVNQGTLQANNTNAIQSSSLITVNNVGMLSLTANSALNTPSASMGVGTAVAGTTSTPQVSISLTGGTLLRNGMSVSAGTGTTVGIGTLTLAPPAASITSTLDFGTTGVGTLNFNGFLDSTSAPLSVLDYARISSLTSAGTDGTDDRLIFNEQLSAAQLADISFNGVAAQEFVLGNGEYEITPLVAAVPEPSTSLTGALGLCALGWSQRRRVHGLLGNVLRSTRLA